MRAWVTYHSLTSLEDFLMWELDTLQYDAITVCFPSRDTTQPHSLVSLKPNSIRHLIMLRKYIQHLVQDSHLSVSSDATDHALEPDNFLHTTFHQIMSWKLNEITTSSPSPPPSVTAADPSCRILGLQPLIPILQYVNRLGFEICSVNRTRKLGCVNLNWPRCSARVTESLALTDGSFCQKQNTLYFRLCKPCEFMM